MTGPILSNINGTLADLAVQGMAKRMRHTVRLLDEGMVRTMYPSTGKLKPRHGPRLLDDGAIHATSWG
jgi:hypothetical protein